MSLFSTIADDRPLASVPSRSQRTIVIAVVLVAAAIAATVALAPRSNLTRAPISMTAGQLTQAEFIELNTAGLEGLELSSTPVTDNGFLYWNIAAFDNVRPAVSNQQTDTQVDDFLYWNTEAIEYPSQVYHEPIVGPR